MVRPEDPLEHSQQRCIPVARCGRVPRVSGPVGQVAADSDGIRVIRPGHPFAGLGQYKNQAVIARQYRSNHAGGQDRNADSGRHRDDLTQ